MEDTSENREDKLSKEQLNHVSIALLAHVDAGKTTLSEGMLYLSGSIRKLGRVDNKNTFLDTFELERERGITIFSKQAVLPMEDMHLTLLDTPGHADFSAEMERTLQIVDYAILIISGADGVQGHTETLWRLLARYQIPVFLFVNKMDQAGTDRAALMSELKKKLSDNCVDMVSEGGRPSDETLENIAVCDEYVMEQYLENGIVSQEDICKLISGRRLFPCYFGSALKLTGVEDFMRGISDYICCPSYPKKFGAKVYKIARDDQGNRLTYLKVTGGMLRVKDLLTNRKNAEDEAVKTQKIWEEKVNQIRIYSGMKYELVQEARAGMVCAVTGLSKTYPGEGLGEERDSDLPVLEPVLTYQIQLPPDCDVHMMLKNLRRLEEEEPLLHIVWNENPGEILVQMMGEVQIEVLKYLIWERYGVRVEFSAGSIVYKETIAEPVEGIGHYEPLRHYAEVHLWMEPGEPGSGLQFFSDCSEDQLDRNWQRLILTHLEEKEHKGVLTGSAITDMKITLAAGRAHLKHTEGGDFRQATYRAVRQGLKKAKGVLLEPYYEYRLEVPPEMVGRALSDLQRMNGTFGPPVQDGQMTVLSGTVPVAEMRGYQTEMISYTKGKGRLFCTLKGYFPCHNTEEVIEKTGYDSEHDLENPTGSVFCAHGAGFVVKWDEVEQYMHLESVYREKKGSESQPESAVQSIAARRAQTVLSLSPEEEAELERMVADSMRKREQAKKKFSYEKVETEIDSAGKPGKIEKRKEYLLVDGYNIIFAWEELKELAETNLDAARGKLQDILSNYQGMRKCTLILVFDAYKVKGFTGEVLRYHNIYVVFTKEAETADQYIEKVAHEIGRKYNVTVATSDGTEQVIIRGQGCALLSAMELKQEIELARQEIKEIRDTKLNHPGNRRNYLFDYLDDGLAAEMEEVRLGRKNGK